MFRTYPIRAVAYYVQDVEASARIHSALHGSGPFFTIKDVKGAVEMEGRDLTFNHSLAFGQWGTQMVEFIQQNDGSDPRTARLSSLIL